MARRSEADDRTVTAWWAQSPTEDPTVMASSEYAAQAEYYPPRSGRVERPYDLEDSAVDQLLGDLDLDPYVERSSFAPPPVPADVVESYFHPYEVEPETRVAIPALPSEDVIEDYEDYDLDYDTPADPAATEEGTLFLVPQAHAIAPPPSAPARHAVVRGLALAVRPPPSVAPPAPVSAPFVHAPAPVSYERFAATMSSSHPRRPQQAATVRTGHRPETKRGPLVAVSLVGFIATLATLIAGWQLASVPATPPSIVSAPIATVTATAPTETAAPMIAIAPPAFEIPAEPTAAAPAPKPARIATKPATSAVTPVTRLSFSVPASPYGEAPPKTASKQKPKTAEEILEALGEEQLRR